MNAFDSLLAQHRAKPVLLDSNLLLLYLVGTFEVNRIPVFKRTSRYSVNDFDLLFRLVSQFPAILTTPHLLTEVSSLANALPTNSKRAWHEHFRAMVSRMIEVSESATEIMRSPSFPDYGLADAAAERAARGVLLLTEDFRLSGSLASNNLAVLNFVDLTKIASA